MPSSMTSSLVRTRKAWGAPLEQPPEKGRDAHAGSAAPARHCCPGDRCRRRCVGPRQAPAADPRASRAVLAPTSVTIEGAHLQRICQVFYQARERAGARWLPRPGRQPAHPSPGPSTAGGHTPGVWPCVVARTVVQLLRGITARTGGIVSPRRTTAHAGDHATACCQLCRDGPRVAENTSAHVLSLSRTLRDHGTPPCHACPF